MNLLILNDTRVDKHHGCYAVMGAIGGLLEKHRLGPNRYWPAHADWNGEVDFDAALSTANLVVINGEGTIHHDRPAGRLLLQAGMQARAAGVPVALINTGWEANSPDLVAMLDHFDLLSARDSRSAELMRANGADVRVVPDLSLWYANQYAQPAVTAERLGIGFTDNVDRMKSLSLERLRQTCSGETIAISHGDAGIIGWARYLRAGVSLTHDARHVSRLAALLRLRHRLWRHGSAETEPFLARIASLELLVSGRFHACTLALAMGTPVVAQSSNTGKIAALFHDAGLAPWRGEVTLEPSAIEEARERGWSESERLALNAYVIRAVTAAEELFADLAALAARR